MIRDGGSLAATYSDSFQEAVLFLKIEMNTRSDGAWVTTGFEDPVVLGGAPVHWRRPITWNEARQAIQTMQEVAGNLNPRQRQLLAKMAHIAAHDGSVPREERFPGRLAP
jgi:hypothetical protein